MASFNGYSGGTPEKDWARRDRMALAAFSRQSRIAALSENEKTRMLAREIATSLEERGCFSRADAARTGLSAVEVTRLYDRAVERAWWTVPQLRQLAGAA